MGRRAHTRETGTVPRARSARANCIMHPADACGARRGSRRQGHHITRRQPVLRIGTRERRLVEGGCCPDRMSAHRVVRVHRGHAQRELVGQVELQRVEQLRDCATREGLARTRVL